MNYKFNLGNVSINMPGEAKVDVKDISVEVTDFNLKDIPSIIKETRKAFKDIKEFAEQEVKATAQKDQPIEDGFDEFLRSLNESNIAHEQQTGCDCDGDCEGLDHIIAQVVSEAVKAQHPGAQVYHTPMGLAVAIPKNADK